MYCPVAVQQNWHVAAILYCCRTFEASNFDRFKKLAYLSHMHIPLKTGVSWPTIWCELVLSSCVLRTGQPYVVIRGYTAVSTGLLLKRWTMFLIILALANMFLWRYTESQDAYGYTSVQTDPLLFETILTVTGLCCDDRVRMANQAVSYSGYANQTSTHFKETFVHRSISILLSEISH